MLPLRGLSEPVNYLVPLGFCAGHWIFLKEDHDAARLEQSSIYKWSKKAQLPSEFTQWLSRHGKMTDKLRTDRTGEDVKHQNIVPSKWQQSSHWINIGRCGGFISWTLLSSNAVNPQHTVRLSWSVVAIYFCFELFFHGEVMF